MWSNHDVIYIQEIHPPCEGVWSAEYGWQVLSYFHRQTHLTLTNTVVDRHMTDGRLHHRWRGGKYYKITSYTHSTPILWTAGQMQNFVCFVFFRSSSAASLINWWRCGMPSVPVWWRLFNEWTVEGGGVWREGRRGREGATIGIHEHISSCANRNET